MKSLLDFWITHPNFWFNCSDADDVLLSELFEFMMLTENYISPYDRVILYDQLSRHHYRNKCANHIITYFTIKATKEVISIGIDIINNFNPSVWVWMMMPIRHRNNPMDILEIIAQSWRKYKMADSEDNHNDMNILKRFLTATYNSIGYDDVNTIHNKGVTFYRPKVNISKFTSILENTNISVPIIGSKDTKMYKEIATCIGDKHKEVVVSLSGGVDSMVCLHTIMQMPNIQKIIVFHMNHCNRSETVLEEEFIKEWCVYHNIEYIFRRFSEIKRSLCMKYNMRHLYESYTKRIRYEFYKSFGDIPIILGHNKDDMFENILTNISKKQKYCNLEGITKVSSNNIYRPILNIPKSEIFEHASLFKIPYFKNNTPTWSQRGMIRNTVIPALNQWDNAFIPGLHLLSQQISDLVKTERKYVELLMANSKCPNEPNTFIFDTDTILNWSSRIWGTFLDILEIKYTLISLKNLIFNIEKLNASRKSNKRIIHINNHVSLHIIKNMHNGEMYIRLYRHV